MGGLDPVDGWDRTPGELVEYVEAYRERMERVAYMLYNTAGTVGHFIYGHSIKPWEAFPGIIKASMEVMSDEAILAAMEAWCG